VSTASSEQDRPLTFASAAVWTIIALFLDLFFLGMTEAAREGAFFDLVSRTACEALAYAIAFFGILRLHEPETSIRHVLGLKMPSPLAILLGIALGAALSLPSEWLDQVLDGRFPRPPAETETIDRILSVTTLGKRIGLVAIDHCVEPHQDRVVRAPSSVDRDLLLVAVGQAQQNLVGAEQQIAVGVVELEAKLALDAVRTRDFCQRYPGFRIDHRFTKPLEFSPIRAHASSSSSSSSSTAARTRILAHA